MKKILVILGLVLLVGCGPKKIDTTQLAKGNDLIAAGKFDEGITILDELGKLNTDDLGLKQSRIAAHLKCGNYYLTNESVDRKVKYRTALKHFRTVLALDPSNAEAKTNTDLIISIYNQMGRPVPTE